MNFMLDGFAAQLHAVSMCDAEKFTAPTRADALS
jgi:hypothetical protein